MSIYFEKLPENFNQIRDVGNETVIENIWLRINAECKLIESDTQLRLQQNWLNLN